MKKVLTIAGSDSSGGAGIQADLKTMTMHGVYGMSAITALTAQNTTGVTGIMSASGEFVKQQLQAVFSDILPDTIKIGMLANAEIIEAIADFFSEHKEQMRHIPVVLDPVMVTTSGCSLMEDGANKALCEKLFPWATLITPNIPETELLLRTSGKRIDAENCTEPAKVSQEAEMPDTIQNHAQMEQAARTLAEQYQTSVLVKGGHCSEGPADVLCERQEGKLRCHWIPGVVLQNPNKHGTGCTLSSAIASNLALGYNLFESCQKAKQYVEQAIGANLNLGAGSGPLNHCLDKFVCSGILRMHPSE